jgi:large subunit ribosomal protein L18
MKGSANRIIGTKNRPRLSVSVTLGHIYAQMIDDVEGKTLAFASTLDKEFGKKKLGLNKAAAKQIGQMIGKRAVKAGIKDAVFDRGKKRYHGRLKELADAARAEGLKF